MKTIISFSKSLIVVWMVVFSIVAAGCSQATISATGSTPTGRELVVWDRSGGIAGVCQRFTIQNDRTFIAEDCKQEETLGQGQVPEADWSQLAAWQQKYQAFDWKITLPFGSADMFNDAYHFSGTGTQTPSPADQEEINSYLAELFTRLSVGS